MLLSKGLGGKEWGEIGVSNHFPGGFGGRCKVRCGNGLRRNVLLDGVFEVVCNFEVVLGKGFRSIGFSQAVFLSGATV